jgi:hypothetical protein
MALMLHRAGGGGSKVVPEREAVEGRDFFTAEDAENAAAVAEFIEASKVAPERAAAEGGP